MLSRIIKKILKGGQVKKKSEADFSSEEEYYKYLFTSNAKWSSPKPNSDEAQRWNAIFGHINYIKGSNPDVKEFSILDLGSGRGWLSNLLAKQGNVLGIEPVAPVVEFAKKLFPKIGFHAGYISDYIPLLKSENLNLIVCSEVLEHIPSAEKKKFCDYLFEVLKNKGYLILTTPRKDIQMEYEAAYGTPGQPIEEWLSTKEVKALLESAGFKSLNYIGVELPHLQKCPDLEIYQTWLFQKTE